VRIINFKNIRNRDNITIKCTSNYFINIILYKETERLRWFGHVKRMPGNRLPLIVLEWEPEGTRRMGRPKERWIYGVRRSMTNHGLTKRILETETETDGET
jgi:hypothetical protein